jgi:rfaE bifunctional protein kinase chain/domain
MPSKVTDLAAVVERFPKTRVAVVGDMVADVYVDCLPTRVSREAPVLIVEEQYVHTVPGSAANTALNAATLGAKVTAVGVVGRDEAGDALVEMLREAGAKISSILRRRDAATTSKTRVRVGDRHTRLQQAIRIDRLPDGPLTRALERRVLDRIAKLAPAVDGWIVSDYGGPILSRRVVAALGRLSKRSAVVVDSRHRAYEFAGAAAVTPNEAEAEELAGARITSSWSAKAAALAIRRKGRFRSVVLTRGNRGMVIVDRGAKPVSIPIAGTDDIVDVTGAGDTVAAALGLGLAAGAGVEEAARVANYAAGVAVMKSGAAAVTYEELVEAIVR